MITLVASATAFAVEPSDQVYGPVSPKETLGEIGQRVRGEWRIPLKYMVKALYELNPQSFSDSGINGLLVGSMLVVPDLQALSDEVPELLSSTPKPPAPRASTAKSATAKLPTKKQIRSKPSEVTQNSQKQSAPQLQHEQLEQINLLITHSQRNTDLVKKLISQNNDYQKLTSQFQAQVKRLDSQQNEGFRKLRALEAKLKSTAATQKQPNEDDLAMDTNQIDLYLILLLLPILLSIIAILMARQTPKPQTVVAQDFPQDLPPDAAPSAPDLPPEQPQQETQQSVEFDFVEPTPEELKWTEDPTEPDASQNQAPSTEVEAIDESDVSEELQALDDSDLHASLQEDTAETTDTGKTEPAAEAAPETDSEASKEADISDEIQALDISDGQTKLEEAAEDSSRPEFDGDIQELTTTEDEIEAKLSFAYLHIDMGNPEQASKTLDEINLADHPAFADRVNELRAVLAGSPRSQETEPAESTEPSLQAVSDTANKPADTEQTNDSAPATALEKVLVQQIKLANSYLDQGKMEKCKTYIAKILGNGTPEYREAALNLLKQLEQQENKSAPSESESQQSSFELHDLEQTVILKPEDVAASKNKSSTKKDYRDAIPEGLSSRFDAYTDDEEGTKLALAYLFLDLGELDTAKQLLQEVIEGGDPALIDEAWGVLDNLQD